MDRQKANELLLYFSELDDLRRELVKKDEAIIKLQDKLNKKSETASTVKVKDNAIIGLKHMVANRDNELAESNEINKKLIKDNNQLVKDNESERKRGNKFKKLAIGLGIAAGGAALGAGAIGTKAMINHNRNKAMLNKMSNNFIGRLGMRASGYGSAIPKYRRSR